MVDHYRPEVDELEERLDEIEKQVIEDAGETLTGEILDRQARHHHRCAASSCRSATWSAGWRGASST